MNTVSSTESLGISAAGFEQFLAQLTEPEWLLAQRRTAWESFQQMPWPARTDEQWMRSDLRGFRYDKYPMPQCESSNSSLSNAGITERLADGVDSAGVIHTLDGAIVSATIAPEYEKRGVYFGDLSSASQQRPELVQPFLNKIVSPKNDRFAALHAAIWSGGHFLYVPRGVCVEKPFRVLAGMTDGATDTGHTLIVIDEGAEATFLYESNSSDMVAGGFHCGAVEVVVRPGGNFRYVNLQDWGRKVWHFAHQQAVVQRDATLQWTVAALGSRFSQVSQQVSLAGEGANSQVNGVMFTQEKQQLTYNTLQHHKAANCRSDFLYKAALQDNSRTVWRGMIKVDAGAQKTDGYQRNDNLLLSDQARADSIPGLEIEADDVRCTHGSTSGKVDEELIFYCQSRGFTRKEAARLIVAGFFQQIFDRITIDPVREALGQSIARQVREYR
jgi:Fe-S cluster assembly protein SufD